MPRRVTVGPAIVVSVPAAGIVVDRTADVTNPAMVARGRYLRSFISAPPVLTTNVARIPVVARWEEVEKATKPAMGMPPALVRTSGDANESFAEVATRQHVDEGARGRFQALRDVFPVADLAGPDQRDKLLQEAFVMIGGKLA